MANYSFHCDFRPNGGPTTEKAFGAVTDQVRRWLKEKLAGEPPAPAHAAPVHLKDGRDAELTIRTLEASPGRMWSAELKEPVPAGELRTTIVVARGEEDLVLYATLEAGVLATVVAPVHRLDVRCPSGVRRALEVGLPWRVGPTRVFTGRERLNGREGGARLVADICDTSRALPLLVVSEDGGSMIHPGIDVQLAKETVGHARVITLDGEASWEVTHTLGQQWSCYNRAIRVYWPGVTASATPFAHWLWTAARLNDPRFPPEEAAQRFCDQIRWKLMSISTFSVQRPPLLDRIRLAARREEHERLIREAKNTDGYLELADAYARHNTELENETRKLREELAALRNELEQARSAQGWASATPVDPDGHDGEVEPDTDEAPASVRDAVDRARHDFAADLAFGGDVDRGIETLARNAFPDKVYQHLEALARASRAKRANTLGRSLHQWLRLQGVRVSGESETIRNNQSERQRRTWDQGDGNLRTFEHHLKVADGTSPDRCVRIYYDWSDETERIVVGWVGRHP